MQQRSRVAMSNPSQSLAPAAEANIRTVVNLEQEFLQQRSGVERLGDAIADFAGSMRFVILHAFWFGSWIVINSGKTGIQPFDPFPFMFLSMIVSIEAVLLATFVL